MLKNRKNVNRFRNIIIVLITTIIAMGFMVNFAIAADETINIDNGEINPYYRPEWEIDKNADGTNKVEIDKTNKTIKITVKGTAEKTQEINSNVTLNYSSDVTSNLTANDITVYVDGNAESGITKNVTKKQDNPAIYEITLSNFEEAVRRTGLPYKEISGNIRIKIGGRGENSSTFNSNTLVDKYGNHSMMEIDTTGTWLDITLGNTETDRNTANTMFTDFIKPEFTYEFANTTIGNGNNGNTKKVTLLFDVTDKYFASTDLATDTNADLITVKVANETVNTTVNVNKKLTKNSEIIINTSTNEVSYKTVGYTLQANERKVGERYELVIEGLEQLDENGISNGYTYSGPMSISFPSGKAKDLSGNVNDATTITIGVDETDGNPNTSEPSNGTIVDVVDPVWELGDINLTDGIIKLRAKDKYFDRSEITETNITIYVNGVPSTIITKDITSTVATNIIGTVDGMENQIVGKEYTLKIANIIAAGNEYTTFVPTNLTTDNLNNNAGFKYKNENGGNISLKISSGTIYDKSGNTNKEQMLEVGNIDNTSPEVYDVQKVQDKEAKKITITFNVTDKNYDPSDLITSDEVSIWIDNQQIDNITKEITSVKPIKYNVDGEGNKTIGHQYVLVLSNIVETEKQTGKNYLEWSGKLEVKIDGNAARDLKGNTLNPDTTTISDFVDYIDPEIKAVTVESPINKTNKTYTMSFTIIDKYLDATNMITADELKVYIDGEEATDITKTITSTPITATFNKTLPETSTGTTTNGTYTIGYTYQVVLSNFEQSVKQSGKNFMEWSGTVKIEVAQNAVSDTKGNTLNSNATQRTIDGEHVDFIKPVVEKVSSTIDTTAKTETIIFNVMDKYLATSDTLTADELIVTIDGETVTDITKTLTKVQDFTANVNGDTTHLVGQQYKLVLSGFEKSARNSKGYKDWSGTVAVEIIESAMVDTSGNKFASEAEKRTITGDFVDFIKPEIEYTYQSSDIDYGNKRYTMIFDVTDKYYTTGQISIDDLIIKMKNGQKDANGNEITYDLKQVAANGEINITLGKTDKTATFNKTINGTVTNGTYVIGHTYTLTISNLEQLEIKDGLTTADYSGIITVAVAGNKIADTSENKNNATTITSGINIPGGTGSGTTGTPVDVVDPIFTKVSSSAAAIDPNNKTSSTATITFRGTDTYFNQSTLTSDKIKIIVNGTEVSSGITKTLSTATALTEDRILDGVSSSGVKYGEQYTLTITGFAQKANQVKIRIPAGVMTDKYGNSNKETDLIVYNVLKQVEIGAGKTEPFLGESVSSTIYPAGVTSITPMQKQEIEKVIIVSDIKGSKASGVQRIWDVSAQEDGSIIAWTSNTSAPYTVYIGSDDEIFANQNSDALFMYIANGEACTATEVITGLELLNVKSVTRMSYMFAGLGCNAMTSFTLPETFDTSNVTSMEGMFSTAGTNKLNQFSLGSNFDTSNVTTMIRMFFNLGQNTLKTLDLGTKFDTSKVTDMGYLFAGMNSVETLKLGDKFDTKNVTNMNAMFMKLQKINELNLGDKFDTSKVTNMENMFYYCGNAKMTSLDLGDKFNTSKVTNMKLMFKGCGGMAMTALDLGPLFTNIPETNSEFLVDTGKNGACIIYAPEAIYKNKNTFKLSSTDTTNSISYTRGTINPIYKPDWSHTSTYDATNKTLSVTVTGSAYKNQTIGSNVIINYASNVTSTLAKEDIKVYVNGTEVTSTVNPIITVNAGISSTNATTGKTEITHKIVLSNLEEAARRAGLSYKELSGNISIKIAGRGEATSTYAEKVLTDEYGNQTMMEIDTTGTWEDVKIEDAETNHNTANTMFADFIKPEFTYLSSETTVDKTSKTLTVKFSAIDKYFDASNSNLTLSDLTLKVDGEIVDINKTENSLTSENVYDTDGKTRIGTQYTLVVKNLQKYQGTENDSFTYSGIVSIGIPANKFQDLSGNKNNGTTITVGVDDTDGNTQDSQNSNGTAVDVVDPIWRVENSNVITVNGVTIATMDLIATDKFFKESILEKDDIQIQAAGANITTAVPEFESTLSAPTYIKWDNATGIYVETTQENANGVKYKFTLSHLEESDEAFFGERAKYAVNSSTGRLYREYSGPISIIIPAGKAIDKTGNSNLETTFNNLGHVDTLNPEVIKVSSTSQKNTQNVELSKHIVVFDIVDKYLDTSSITTTDTSKIHVYLDGEEANTITKTITNIEQLNATIDGTVQKIGYRYTLELSNFENLRTGIDYNREYTDWSGDLTIKIEANTAYDVNPADPTDRRGNVETILAGNEDKTSNLDYADFVDYIKPDATYQYADSDVKQDAENGKTFTMTFDVTDKFYKEEELSLSDIRILISAENQTGVDQDKYDDLTTNENVGKTLTSENITNTVNGVSKVIGKRYKLVLSNLEQIQKTEGKYYLDYSGVITIVIPKNKIKDTSGNGNDATSITSGINIPGGEISDVEVIDVVAPIWEKVSSTTDIHTKTAVIKVRGTDKYFLDNAEGYGTLTLDEIKFFVNGIEQTGNISISGENKLYEDRVVIPEYGDGEVSGSPTTETVQYGVEYTITITNFPINEKQVKIQLTEGSLIDKSNNKSKAKDFMIYSSLVSASTETEATSKFLGEIPKEGKTAIARQDIEKVVFVNSIQGSTATGVQNVWDVSAQRDSSILAWYSETSAPYTVYIGSDEDIYGNIDSSYLFSYIGYGSACTSETAIENIELLDVSNVTNMRRMFYYTGYTAMTSFDLGDKFDTSNVINMQNMFYKTGYESLKTVKLGGKFDTSEVKYMSAMFWKLGYESEEFTTLNLGTKFDTSSVIYMSQMFGYCGYTGLTSLDLGDKFDTSNVKIMNKMFYATGYTAMTSLNLGDKFNTINVTTMSGMFEDCGYKSMTSLELGNKFDTSNVTDMSEMFTRCGHEKLTKLNLGNKFDTSKVTNMNRMFGSFASKLESLDLGDKFDTTNVTDMTKMFDECGNGAMTTLDLGPLFTNIASTNDSMFSTTGKSGGCTIYAPESIYKNKNAFKLSSTSTTGSISYTQGTINPIYKPEWTKQSSTFDATNKTLSVIVKGSAYENKVIDSNVTINYASNVTSTLAKEDIKVYVNGVEVTSTVNPTITVNTGATSTNSTTGKTEITHTITLSNLEEAIRQTGKSYKEWSGNISIKIAGRGEATSTYTAKVLTDQYGNQSMMETDESGTWINVTFEDTDTDHNTDNTMFTDFIKPEFTYEYLDTIIGNGPEGDKKVIVTFDVTDKYFESTQLSTDGLANLITVKVDEDVAANAVITKTLTKVQDLVDTVNGDANHKVGERYQLTIEGLEMEDGSGYSGPMTLVFSAGIVEDKSGNVNNATTITIGIDEPENPEHPDHDEEVIVDVVDPIIKITTDEKPLSYINSQNVINRDKVNETGTVKVVVRIEDKYLDKSTANLVAEAIKVKVQKPDGTVVEDATKIENPITVTVVEKATTDADKFEYEITLGNFTTNEGITSITIPKGIIKDKSGNVNKETELYVGNATWTGDGEYTAFRESIVDFTMPKWSYVTSSISRNRDGEIGTVTLKILGYDIYKKEVPTADELKSLINVYVNNTKNTNIQVAVQKDTDTETSAEYTVTLSNFGTNDGQVKISIPENAMKDTSGNGNKLTEILVGNTTWIENDVETDTTNPIYTAFRDSIVDFIKPVIKYQYEENVNPVLDRENETVKITFTTTDTNYIGLTTLPTNLITLDKMKIYIDDMLVHGDGVNAESKITASLSHEVITDGSANGIKYTLTLSALELNKYLENEIFERHSGVIKLVFEKDQVADTSGNKNIETTIIVDNDNGDDNANGVIVDFVNPNIDYRDKYINWEKRYALVTLRATDRFYDENTALQPSDITLYEQKDNGEYIQINNFDGKIEIKQKSNGYGKDIIIKLNDFEEEFKMKIKIAAGKIGDTSGNFNDETEIIVTLDNKKPTWNYVNTDTTKFETEGKLSFTVKGQDKFLDTANSSLDVSNLKVLKDGEVYLDGSNSTDATKITVNYDGMNETEKSKTYTIDITGLTEVATYSLVFAKDTLVDEFGNTNAATTISFSKSAITANTGNYTNITYHVSPDLETKHHSYVHELMSVNTTGTNFENTTYRPSSLGELFNNGENPLFAEPMYVPSVDGYTVSQVYAPKSFAGWAEADSDGNVIEGGKTYGLYDEIPNTVTNLKAVWQDATVVFVSSTGNNSNDGKLPTSPVKDLKTAYSKLNTNGTAESNIIVIMDAVEFNSSDTLTGNATITSLYAGVDYRATQNAELKVSVSQMTVKGSIIFDNIELYTDNDTMLVSNYSGDITMGRGITTPEGRKTLYGIFAGNYLTETTTGELGTHTVRVEVGKYTAVAAGSLITSNSTATKSVTHNIVIGNMRDAAISRNDKLYIEMMGISQGEKNCYPSGATSSTLAENKVFANITLYSGTINNGSNHTIYLRSFNGSTDGLMNFEMFGGKVIGDIYGGSRVANTAETTVFNTMKFYGGTVTGNIYGQGENDTFTGSSSITLQGNFSITGDIYGGSYRSSTTTGNVGKGDSTILVNSSSVTVNGSIYGGGRIEEEATGYINGATNITINSGTISGNIYGSGYNCGNADATNITIENGAINGNIYGGAYQNQARTTSNITVLGGTIGGNIHGGNNNISSQLEDDAFFQNVNITIGDTDTSKAPTINGVIYGGGKYDKVDKATIHLIECANITSVYGGSEGSGLTITSDIYLEGMTVNEIYGGSNGADDATATVSVSKIHLQSGTVTDVYGGGFNANSTQADITLEGTSNVTNIYGGPNTGRKVTTSEITLKSGTVTNVFGGGNSAQVGTSNVTLDGITIDAIYGGSKDAGLTDTANVTLVSGTVTNVFGGGLNVGATKTNIKHQGEATVTNIYGGSNGGETGTTNIDILNSTVENIYGGNYMSGTTQNANINVHGTATVTGNIFGGGYKTSIGKNGATGSATINIAGGTINGDINGGSEQGKVYGNTKINVGFDAIENTSLTPQPINIIGTIYGAGSTLTKGEVTVVGNTIITMDNGTTYPISYYTADGKEKSIYGSGKGGAIYSNGTEIDQSTIHLKDFGTAENIYMIKSIENTGTLYIGNSTIELVGALDKPEMENEIGHYYTLNTITNSLTVYANTTLYTQRGFNKVGGYYSYLKQKNTKATVTITDGTVTTNVDNRLYTLEGVNLIFAKKEVTLENKATLQRADWGEVTGMTYFGTYKNTSTGKKYDLSLFKAGTYVEAQYNTYHDINSDGFYTNTEDGAQIIETVNYTNYCDWIVNAPTVNYDIDLIASAYGQHSIAEILLDKIYSSDYTYAPETIYTVNGVSTNALKSGIELVDPTDPNKVPTVSANANNVFGLTMETVNSGWKQKASTTILTADNGSFDGSTIYASDKQSTPGSIKFKIYNSLNITEEKDLGIVTIKLTGQQPVNGSGTESYTFNVVIAVNLQTLAIELKDQYTPMFKDKDQTEISYTTDSKVDLTYILFNTKETTPYASNDYRVISTTMPLPTGTKLTMKDYGQGDTLNKVYYYQVATDTDYYGTDTVDGVTRYLYKLTKFTEMGSTNSLYTDSTTYYNSSEKYVLEKYDLSIDFVNANVDAKVSSEILARAQETYLELRTSSGSVKFDNGDTTIKYNLVPNKNAIAQTSISNEGSSYSVVETIEIPITIDGSILEQNGILDTKYHSQIAGIAVQIVGENNVRIKAPELQNFKLTDNKTGEVFTADSNGVIRMPIIEGLGSSSSDYTLSVTQSDVSPGTYRAQVMLYTADDGKYYGTETETEPLEFNITFISRLAGLLGVKAEDESSRIIDKTTGLNLVDGITTNKAIDLTIGIANPSDETNIRVELYKRNPTYTDLTDETTYTGASYTLVDIKDYLQGTWTEAEAGSKEYIISEKKTYSTPVKLEMLEFERAIKEGISSGEYKLEFKAYSDDTLVQTFSKTFIVIQ